MPNFELYFNGLICFWADQPRIGEVTPKTHALFVLDDDHRRVVITPDDQPHFDGFTWLKIETTGGTSGTIDTIESAFVREVPHLGDDRVSRAACLINPGRAIKVELPKIEGELRVAQRFAHEGSYSLDGKTDQHPVARITVLQFEAASVSISGDGDNASTLTLSAGSPWVALLNASSQVQQNDNHFKRYARILKIGGNVAKPEDVAMVVDVEGTQPPEINTGAHISAVKNLTALKESQAAKQASRGLNDEGGETLTQTQCSNSQWP